ncbi:MAG TPA: glutamate--tRNA ligase family protein [Candidatus Limnocylindrales bacterium]|nr:glutamate--tRNA ligase family protein [Candidatus Limnocylindrales bacterium]
MTADPNPDPDDAGELFVPVVSGSAVPDPGVLPSACVTRFAPAPTGYLHLGHLVNALYTWGIARATGGRVILRVEDHDRQRSRPAYEAALLDDLDRLGLAPDEPVSGTATFRAGQTLYRQSDAGAVYRAALDGLREQGLAYACACSRTTFAAYEAAFGRAWRGIGCPGGCRDLALREQAGTGLRIAVGAGVERWVDLLAGPLADEPAATGDLLARDRVGNWTYAFCVVVDDARHGVDLVIRGRDLLDATPAQLRLGRLLGRDVPTQFLHHPLIRRVSGQKLSKAEGDTAVRLLLDAGRTPAELFGLAARLAGLQADEAPIDPADLAARFRAA